MWATDASALPRSRVRPAHDRRRARPSARTDPATSFSAAGLGARAATPSPGLLFISPWLVGFLGFYLYPAAGVPLLQLHRLPDPAAPEWIGLQNYQRMVDDPLLLEGPLEHDLAGGRDGPDLGRGRARGLAAPERPGDLRDVDLPDDLLPAGRGAGRRERRPVDLVPQPEVRAGQRRPWVSSGSTARNGSTTRRGRNPGSC